MRENTTIKKKKIKSFIRICLFIDVQIYLKMILRMELVSVVVKVE